MNNLTKVKFMVFRIIMYSHNKDLWFLVFPLMESIFFFYQFLNFL